MRSLIPPPPELRQWVAVPGFVPKLYSWPAPPGVGAIQIPAIEIAAALARRFEGLRLRPYLCPTGVPTIGYGATYYEDGTRVTLKDEPISRERADELLLWMLRTVYLPAVVKLCPGIDTPERAAAIIDFTFNLGTGRLKASTLRRKVNARDWGGAKVELMKWTKAGGRELAGLVKRRQAEVGLI